MRILGIELGGFSVKAVELESRFRRIDVVDLHEIRLPLQSDDLAASYRKAITELIARLPVHPEKIVTSLPAAQTSIRVLQIPVKQRKKVEQSFRFELEDAVPFKLEDAIIEHKVSPMATGSLVIAAIAPKRFVQSYLEWLKGIGLDPDWLTFEGMGIINLYLASQSLKKKEDRDTVPTLLLDIGHTKTNISICNQGRLEFSRSLAWGGLAITQSISTGLVLNLDEAEHKKTHELRIDEEAPIPNTEVEELISSGVQALTPFISDLSHSIVAYRSQFKSEIGKVYLTGGTAKLSGIDDFLTKQLNLPVEFFKPFREGNYGKNIDPTQEMRFGETLGRALVFNRKSEFLFNFRQEEMAKETSLREIGDFLNDPNVIKLLRYTAILAALLFVGVFPLKYIAATSANKAQIELKKVIGDTFKSVPEKMRSSLATDPAKLKQFINQKNTELTQRLKLASSTQISIGSLLKAVSDSFPPAPTVDVDVNLITLTDRDLRIEGVVYRGSLELVTENLKKISSFKNIDLKTDGQRFTYKGEVVRK